jgi:Domain of unknown function (DUF3883)
LSALNSNIALRTSRTGATAPDYGHDFLSFSADGEYRYIEVKCVAKVSDGHSSFSPTMSTRLRCQREHGDGYYFYLVYVSSDGKPAELEAVLAKQLYPKVELLPSSYEVRFDRQEFKETEE